MNKTAFLLVVYPGIENHINKCLSSLSSQSNKHFDLVIINDGFENILDLTKNLTLNVIIHNFFNTPSKNREFGINIIKDSGYDFLIFGDADDYFSQNRVEQSIRYLENYDIVVNDFALVDQKNNLFENKYLSNRINNNQLINAEFILDKNIFGLSNTAINLKKIKKVNLSSKLRAVDWFLFSKLLLEEFNAVFTNETLTYYRQHHNNYIGINHLNEEKILRGLEVKVFHYGEMRNINRAFEEYYQLADELYKSLLSDKNVKEKYITNILNNKIKFPLWWEEIKV